MIGHLQCTHRGAKAHASITTAGLVTSQALLDQLPPETKLELGHAHHGRKEDDGRTLRRVAPADEHAFQALALELQRDRAFLAHKT